MCEGAGELGGWGQRGRGEEESGVVFMISIYMGTKRSFGGLAILYEVI